jgi:hypothetical protein
VVVSAAALAPQCRLRQGEILSGLTEYVPKAMDDSAGAVRLTIVGHPLVLVLSPECDLVSDAASRKPRGSASQNIEARQSNVLRHLQFADLFVENEVRNRFNSKSWPLVRENRDERYHRVPSDEIENFNHPPLYLDFKRIFSASTEYLYAVLEEGTIGREGVVPSLWINQLVQRCYVFNGRICVPDANDPR